MTPAFTFLAGLAMLVLFGWYFATDQGPRKRLLAKKFTNQCNVKPFGGNTISPLGLKA